MGMENLLNYYFIMKKRFVTVLWLVLWPEDFLHNSLGLKTRI